LLLFNRQNIYTSQNQVARCAVFQTGLLPVKKKTGLIGSLSGFTERVEIDTILPMAFLEKTALRYCDLRLTILPNWQIKNWLS